MRILRLTIDSLASLRGPQPTIDFEHGPLSEPGVVAITGPTGAGKSTLLDAICLALFRQTPRLSGGDVHELVSRGAKRASVRLELEHDDGARWICDWSLTAARPRSGVNDKLTVTDAATGKVLASGKKEAVALIGEKLGLTFEQFRGVILLSQGDFARFLNAETDKRAALLERLTATTIYSDLSRAAHERLASLEGALALEAVKLEAQQVLSGDERAALEQRQAALAGELAVAGGAVDAARRRKEALETLVRLLESARRSAVELAAARGASLAAGPGRARLARAERAQHLAPPLALAAERRQSLAARTGELERASSALVRLEAELAASRADARAAWGGLLGEARSAEVAAARLGGDSVLTTPLLERLRQQHAALTAAANVAQDLAERSRGAAGAAAAAAENAGAARQASASSQRAVAEREVAHQALAASLAALLDAASLEALALREQRLKDLERLVQRHAWVETPKKAEAAQRCREQAEAAAQAEAGCLRTHEALAAEALAHRAAHEAAVRSARVSELVHLLTPGEPCPLCGSPDHPAPATAGDRVVTAKRLLDETTLAEGQALLALQAARVLRRSAEAALHVAETALQEAQRADEEHHLEWRRLTSPDAARGGAGGRPDGDPPGDQGLGPDPAPGGRPLPATPGSVDGAVGAAGPELLPASLEALRSEHLTSALEVVKRRRAERVALGEQAKAAAQAVTDAATAASEHVARLADLEARAEVSARAAAEALVALSAAEATRGGLEASWLGSATQAAATLGEPCPPPAQLGSWLTQLEARRAALAQAGDLHAEAQRLVAELQLQLPAVLPGELVTAAAPVGPGGLEALRTRRQTAAAAFARAGTLSADRERAAAARTQLGVELQQSATALAEAEAVLLTARVECGFETEADACAAALEPAALASLRADLTLLDQRRATAEASMQRAAAELEAHRRAVDGPQTGSDADAELEAHRRAMDGPRTGAPADADAEAALVSARADLTGAEAAKEQLGQAQALAADALGRDDAARAARAAAEVALGEQRKALDTWARLDALIGHNAGARFSRFAQALTLDQLVALANLRLKKISDRYRLARVGGAEVSLDLEVIDRHLADERRPVTTLSGGETFLVSLALALALADLKRGSLKLGTLFIDEGFGSLDRDTLQQAIETLRQLQQEQGTKILVISHVPALQEALVDQLRVEKLGGGRSALRVAVATGA